MSKDGKELARLLYKDLLVRYNDFQAAEVASVKQIYTSLRNKASTSSDFVGQDYMP
jgi:hypothetical protein